MPRATCTSPRGAVKLTAENSDIVNSDEIDGDTFSAETTTSTNAGVISMRLMDDGHYAAAHYSPVNVLFTLRGEIIVDDERYLLNVCLVRSYSLDLFGMDEQRSKLTDTTGPDIRTDPFYISVFFNITTIIGSTREITLT